MTMPITETTHPNVVAWTCRFGQCGNVPERHVALLVHIELILGIELQWLGLWQLLRLRDCLNLILFGGGGVVAGSEDLFRIGILSG